MATIERIGRESGAYMTMIQTDSQLITKGQIWGTRNYGPKGDTRPNAKNLNFFDAIFFYGSGDSELTEQQKADLLSFVHDDGKGFIGAHAANVAFQKWPDYLAMLGGYDNEDFPTVDMPVVIEDPKFPGMSAFPHSFTFKDEFPDLSRSKFADKVHVIVRLDATRLTPQQLAGRSADREFPIAWAKKYGKGRVFFSSFGHRDETWDDPRVQKMYLEAIKWALGQGEADLTPQPLPGSTK
jgi:type 1 glutamine amidotransferase